MPTLDETDRSTVGWPVKLIHLFLGHLHLKGSAEKMSKSLKNYITIKVGSL